MLSQTKMALLMIIPKMSAMNKNLRNKALSKYLKEKELELDETHVALAQAS